MVNGIDSLRERHSVGEQFKYVFFWGHQPGREGLIDKSCFSQWYEAAFEREGIRYPTAEHYMMAAKADLFGDESSRARIIAAPNPGAAKRFGREVEGFDAGIWDRERFAIVVDANLAKFSQNPTLEKFLLGTADRVLVEASPVDSIWGIGMAQDHSDIKNPASWLGLNLLGFALMEVRAQLSKD